MSKRARGTRLQGLSVCRSDARYGVRLAREGRSDAIQTDARSALAGNF
jgi:hypothetical protein